ncbi:ABC transporter permease subunit [Lacinutrix sp. WUR7]|nr:ABC transporter permease [Lacinutrix sp. WUR7]QRM90795.1 ABC transporter permease subunit [Lacinutrix sp. WUR7]
MFKNWPIYQVFKREMLRLAKQKSIRNLFVIIPFIVFFLLGSIYYKGSLREVSIAVYDNDNSTLSRMYIRFLESSPYLNVTQYLSSKDAIESAFVKDHVQGVFYIPKDFHKDVLKSNPVQVKIYTNSTNIVFGNLLYKAGVGVTQSLSGAVVMKRIAPLGINPSKIMGTVLPIKINTRVLGNPQYNYVYYLLPGLTTVLLQMIIFLAASRAFNKEWESQTYNQLYATAKGNILAMILGKYFAFLVYGLGLCGLIFAVVFPVFRIPIYGNSIHLLALLILFLSVNILLGFGLSLIVKNQIIALDIAVFYNSPAFVFSGFTFPIWAMPWFNSVYAQAIPYTHFLTAFLKIYQLDTPLFFIWPEVWKLMVFLIVGVFLIALGLIMNRKHIFITPKLTIV